MKQGQSERLAWNRANLKREQLAWNRANLKEVVTSHQTLGQRWLQRAHVGDCITIALRYHWSIASCYNCWIYMEVMEWRCLLSYCFSWCYSTVIYIRALSFLMSYHSFVSTWYRSHPHSLMCRYHWRSKDRCHCRVLKGDARDAPMESGVFG